MRNETPDLWGIEFDPTDPTYGALRGWIDRLGAGPPRRRDFFAVEVCWISDGAVTCRTYPIRATDEARAARAACQRAGKDVGARVSRIEAVDVEPLPRGNCDA